jgi:hypothetical protein
MAGTFTLSPDGKLVLALARGCTCIRIMRDEGRAWFSEVSCDRAWLTAVHVVALTPWGDEIRGTWNHSKRITFHVDWQKTNPDPTADDVSAVAARPWMISGTRWTPTSAEAKRIHKLIEDATETAMVRGGPAPTLEVTTLGVADGVLHAGGESTLVVRIVNRGPGTAYRVVATTRSSVATLHGLRLAFGVIEPGVEKIRRLRVTVPDSETTPDAMLVLMLAEANGVTPPNISRRIPIAVPPGKRKVCSAGQLTRARYRAKLTELRAAMAAGDITQAQLDRYDAELIMCLE